MKETNITDRILYAFAVVWPLGQMPAAPGTWGSAGAALLAPFLFLPLPYVWRVVVLIALFGAGIAAAARVEQILGRKDPGRVVIDEFVAVWFVTAPFDNLSWPMIIAAFVLFRVFDIAKPWPVKQAELKFAGGLGVMIDDIVAGVYALIGMGLIGLLI